MKLMRFLVILMVLGIIAKFLLGMGKQGYTSVVSDTKAKTAVERIKEKLPMTLENGLRIDSADYKDRVMSMYATEEFKQEISVEQRQEYKKSLLHAYCRGMMKVIYDDHIALEYVFTTQARSLNDLSTETWKVTLQPGDC
ncbi:hypothetical protein ACO0LC_27920 [Undibacterium sp. JH2W]|uniref:hypothetical protein n=1 Tax=Undibacterium sp. JH2W TaxID=3413037 RepID=UPI003BF275F0